MTNRSGIVFYLKCIWCDRDRIEPRIEIGYTTDGNLQLWCMVHDAAIGPPFELRRPPLIAHMTCHDCHETAKRTYQHEAGPQDHAQEQVGGHDHGHEHDHKEEH